MYVFGIDLFICAGKDPAADGMAVFGYGLLGTEA
jgi:hypothetical protein